MPLATIAAAAAAFFFFAAAAATPGRQEQEQEQEEQPDDQDPNQNPNQNSTYWDRINIRSPRAGRAEGRRRRLAAAVASSYAADIADGAIADGADADANPVGPPDGSGQEVTSSGGDGIAAAAAATTATVVLPGLEAASGSGSDEAEALEEAEAEALEEAEAEEKEDEEDIETETETASLPTAPTNTNVGANAASPNLLIDNDSDPSANGRIIELKARPVPAAGTGIEADSAANNIPGLMAASGSGSSSFADDNGDVEQTTAEHSAVEEAEAGGADANDEAAPGQGHDDEAASAIVASADALPATDGRSPQSLLTPRDIVTTTSTGRDIVTTSSGGDGIAAAAATAATATVVLPGLEAVSGSGSGSGSDEAEAFEEAEAEEKEDEEDIETETETVSLFYEPPKNSERPALYLMSDGTWKEIALRASFKIFLAIAKRTHTVRVVAHHDGTKRILLNHLIDPKMATIMYKNDDDQSVVYTARDYSDDKAGVMKIVSLRFGNAHLAAEFKEKFEEARGFSPNFSPSPPTETSSSKVATEDEDAKPPAHPEKVKNEEANPGSGSSDEADPVLPAQTEVVIQFPGPARKVTKVEVLAELPKFVALVEHAHKSGLPIVLRLVDVTIDFPILELMEDVLRQAAPIVSELHLHNFLASLDKGDQCAVWKRMVDIFLHSPVKVLDASANAISDETVLPIILPLLEAKSLQHVDLSKCGMGAEGAGLIAASLCRGGSDRIRSIALGENDFSDGGGLALIPFLVGATGLEVVKADSVRLGGHGTLQYLMACAEMTQSLPPNTGTGIKTIDLSDCSLRTGNAFNDQEWAPFNSDATYHFIDPNDPDPDIANRTSVNAIPALIALVESSPLLGKFTMTGSNATPGDITRLLSAIEQSGASLNFLNLSYEEFDFERLVVHIANRHINSLTELHLEGTYPNSDDLEVLLPVLASSNLRVLNLSCNELDEESLATLANADHRIKTLEVLNLYEDGEDELELEAKVAEIASLYGTGVVSVNGM